MKLDLNDLMPEEASFELSGKPGQIYTMKKFSLAVQIWMRNRFGKENIEGIFRDQSLPEISELVLYLLKDKSEFPTLESFQESIVTQKDRLVLIQSLLKTIGISQPLIEKLSQSEEFEGNENSPSLEATQTGAKSLT